MVKESFSGAKEQYNARGITDTRPDVFGLEWVTERIAIVDVRWPYLDERGKEVGEEASTYTLRRDDAGDLKLHGRVYARRIGLGPDVDSFERARAIRSAGFVVRQVISQVEDR
ncbi:MAG TPA: hypothetical protein VFL31_07245 [Nitrospiraceae bacterium]|nr:hypothetical protein [Nitrospiraceae bacterium]